MGFAEVLRSAGRSSTESRKEVPAVHPYRADIDGLRAIAIAPVVLFHAGMPGLEGGFVGVDVFFVISGFLMASLITSELDMGTFSLLRFYERRVRRIFPALFAMIAASAVAAWCLFMPIELEYFSRSVAAAALFGSNILFEQKSGYFDIAAQLKPLLHTWSLAVEEQFYIAFPLSLVLLRRMGRQWVAPVLGIALLISLGLSIWKVERAPQTAFFLSQYRFWELLLGALLAFDLIPRPTPGVLRQGVAALGLGLIAFAIFAFDKDTTFPGLAAIVPCLGAAMVVHAKADAGPVGRALSSPPLVFLGLISYSLYLWHWPFFVFARYILDRSLSLGENILLIVLSIIVSSASWQFIEQPFRSRSSPVSRANLRMGAIAAVTIAVVFGVYVSVGRGLPGRLTPEAQKLYAASYDGSQYLSQKCFIDTTGKGPSLSAIRAGSICRIGKAVPKPEFVVWGDSHAAAMAPAIDIAASRSGHGGLFVARGGCPPLLDYHFGKTRIFKDKRCRDFNQAAFDLVERRHIPVVFMLAFWPKYVHRAELPGEGIYYDPRVSPPLADWSAPVARSLALTLGRLTQIGTRVILVMDVPEIGYKVPEALAKAAMKGTSPDIAPSRISVLRRQALSRQLIQMYAARYHASVIDPVPAFCDKTHCDVERDGTVFYRDSDHITGTAAKSLDYLFSPIFGAPPF